MKPETDKSIYLKMPLSRVIEDARAGVSAARTAWRRRDPDGAGRVLGYVVDVRQVRSADREERKRDA